MAWFAVDARWTRSVRWLYASRPARLGWYALAELANELRTPGIIPDARDRDRAVADAARMRLGELRACVRDGLAHYADDGSLRLDGWLNVGEDRPPRTESTAPLPPRRAAPLTGAPARAAPGRGLGAGRRRRAGPAASSCRCSPQRMRMRRRQRQTPARPAAATSGACQRRRRIRARGLHRRSEMRDPRWKNPCLRRRRRRRRWSSDRQRRRRRRRMASPAEMPPQRRWRAPTETPRRTRHHRHRHRHRQQPPHRRLVALVRIRRCARSASTARRWPARSIAAT